MTPAEPTVFQSVAVVLLCAWLLLQSGFQKKQLGWRIPRRRRCVGCRHDLDDCRCDSH